MILKNLEQLLEQAEKKGRKRLVVAAAQDEDVLLAVKAAVEKKLVEPVLVGNRDEIISILKAIGLDSSSFQILHEPDKNLACQLAVQLIRQGNGDILMKGIVTTGMLVKAILDKEKGLLKGMLLSHVAFFQSKYYPKVICVTDAALNIAPNVNEKAAIIRNAVSVCHKIGIEKPLVAVLAAVETVNPKMEATVHAEILTGMQKQSQIEGCIVEGPLALDNAVSEEAAHHKGLTSDVAGHADVLLVPDLNSGNILYKSLNFLGGAVCAAVVAGAAVPVVLTSRADEDRSKFLSIALAVALS
ncbi:MAG TPA: bifunctional enoyl-CoA hydratase/phosphate acetyltransferase [Bacteroidales bacterium]|nr:bifunctional enoyl-CoA hydratase/phosphate acetyltransferase [Bacteroidales bacterium]